MNIGGLVPKRCNSIASAMELHLSCTNPLEFHLSCTNPSVWFCWLGFVLVLLWVLCWFIMWSIYLYSLGLFHWCMVYDCSDASELILDMFKIYWFQNTKSKQLSANHMHISCDALYVNWYLNVPDNMVQPSANIVHIISYISLTLEWLRTPFEGKGRTKYLYLLKGFVSNKYSYLHIH